MGPTGKPPISPKMIIVPHSPGKLNRIFVIGLKNFPVDSNKPECIKKEDKTKKGKREGKEDILKIQKTKAQTEHSQCYLN